MPKSSASLSASSSSRAASSALTRSSRGSARRAAKRSGQVGDELAHLVEEPLQRLVVERRCDDRVRPLLEAGVVGTRHAEHLCDHRDRQRERVVGGEVHLAARLDGVEQLVGDRLDPRAQLLDHPRRERLRDEAPEPAVVVAVPVEHVVLDQLEGRRQRLAAELLLGQREPRVADEALVVEQHAGGVLVPGDEPDHRLAVDPRLAEDGVVLAHLREDAVRIGAELRRCRGRTCASSTPRRTSLDCAAVSEKTLKLTLEYDGTGFRGWARQPGERTVEGALARRSTRSTGAGATSPSPAARTPACTRPPRSPRGRLLAARRRSARRGAQRRPAGRRRRDRASSPPPTTSAPASRLARARTATGSCAAACALRSPTGVRSGGRGRSISRRSRRRRR